MSKQGVKFPTLVMQQGPQPQQAFPLHKNLLTIGRAEDNDIVINDAEISRHHARLTWQGNNWVIEDLGSSNGTYINGQRISGPTILVPGAQLRLGPDVFMGLQIGPAKTTRPTKKTRQRRSKWLLPVGIAGAALAVLSIGVLAFLGYSYFTGVWPFGVAQVEDSGPGVTIQQPVSNAQLTKGESFPVFITASDDQGVVRIDFWVDDQLMITQSSSDENGLNPLTLSYPMVAVEAGTYALTAQAYNSQGEMGESLVHYVSVHEATASTQDLAQYIVQDGDSLDSIAAKAGTTAAAIQQANPSTTANGQVKAGQQIVVPVKPASQSKAVAPPAQPNKLPPQPQAPVKQPGINSLKISASPSPVFYGQTCTNEPTMTNAVLTVDPVNAVQSATLKYLYYGKAGNSVEQSVPLTLKGGLFSADLNAGAEAEKTLAQDGGWIMLWAEVVGTDGKTSLTKASNVTVIHCSKIVPPGGPAGGPAGGPIDQLPRGNGILPGLQIPGPVQQILPAAQGPIPGVVASILPHWNPIGNQDQTKPDVTAPGNPQANVDQDQCTVSLSWDDAQNETGYRITRYVWGQPQPLTIANNLKANTTSFKDTLPGAGKYGYRVSAVQDRLQAPSKLMWVEMKTSEKCPPSPKRLFFQPLTFKPNDSSISKAFLWVTLDGFSPLRVPKTGQDYYPVGDWSGAGEFAIPLPETVFSKSGDTIFLEVQANGFTSTQPKNLRWGRNVRSFDDVNHANAKNINWDLGAETFEFFYRMWLDNWYWGSKIKNSTLPSPYNLKLDLADPLAHKLTWEYDAKSKPLVDGFIVYGNYSCPSGLQASHYVITKNLTANNPSADQQISIPTYKQPKGCSCYYQVSAFDATGESDLSKVTTLKCETGAPDLRVRVSFDTIEIKNLSGTTVSGFWIMVDKFVRASNALLLENKTYKLEQMQLAGARNHNDFIFSVPVGDSVTLQPNFHVNNMCMGGNDIKLQQPAAGWTDLKEKFSFTSNCSSRGCQCIVNGTIEVLSLGPGAPSSGPVGMTGTGETCQKNTDCASNYCVANVCTPIHKGLNGAACFANEHCVSGVCDCYREGRPDLDHIQCPLKPAPGHIAGTCLGPSKNQQSNGAQCKKDNQCASSNCENGLCAPDDGLGQIGDYCHHNDHCFNEYCLCPNGYDGDYCKGYKSFTPKAGEHGTCGEWPGLVNGSACSKDDECQSRHCEKNMCVPIDETGLLGEFCFSSDHCYSERCMCPDDTYRLDSKPCTGYESFTSSKGGSCWEP